MNKLLIPATLATLALAPVRAEAVCFKALNETNLTLRGRVYDRGAWRPWVDMLPRYWDCFAPQVKRTEHPVQFEYRTGAGTWQPFYDNHHGSRLFTRVVHFEPDSNGSNNLSLKWYDEPPGCRDKPPGPGRPGSCLKPSGWLFKEIFKILLKIIRIPS